MIGTVNGCRVYRGTSMAIPVQSAGVFVSAAGRKFKVGVR